jgi:hypothetical protein
VDVIIHKKGISGDDSIFAERKPIFIKSPFFFSQIEVCQFSVQKKSIEKFNFRFFKADKNFVTKRQGLQSPRFRREIFNKFAL